MSRYLVVYSSQEGQTEKIAKFLERELRSLDAPVDVFGVQEIPRDLQLSQYSNVIIGGSVHFGRYSKDLRDWVRDHLNDLGRMNSAFYSVCLGIQEDSPVVREAEKSIVFDFFRETGWSPNRWTIFAGALHYSRYGWLKKRLMKMIAAKAGENTRTDRDYEYTNWADVKRFVNEFQANCELPRRMGLHSPL